MSSTVFEKMMKDSTNAMMADYNPETIAANIEKAQADMITAVEQNIKFTTTMAEKTATNALAFWQSSVAEMSKQATDFYKQFSKA